MELYFSGELGAVRTMMGKFGLYRSMKKMPHQHVNMELHQA